MHCQLLTLCDVTLTHTHNKILQAMTDSAQHNLQERENESIP